MPRVIALAGRRIDAVDADTARFPLENVPLVRDRLRRLFAAREATVLVCSGACGADLVALETAELLGLQRRIVLPFAPERFRETSVVDRPGDWGPLYDPLIAAARRTGDLVLLQDASASSEAYAAANAQILEEALALAGGGSEPAEAALAVIVWEGRSRGSDDATLQFADLCRKRRLPVEVVRTT